MHRCFWLLGAVLLSVPGPLAGQSILAGFVRADSSERPIAGVEVLIEGSDRRGLTDARGKFVISGLPVGARIALFRSVGWRPVRLRINLAVGDTVWTEATLIKESVQLAPVEVTAAPISHGMREEFEERRRMGFGQFIDSTVLRSSEHLRVSDIMRRRISGIRLEVRGSAVFAMSIRRPGCYMQVILDGNVLFKGVAPSSTPDSARIPDLARDFDTSALEAIEVYRGAAETPGEFSGPAAACGTVVLWSRLGR